MAQKGGIESLEVFTGDNLHSSEGTWLGDGTMMLRRDQVIAFVAKLQQENVQLNAMLNKMQARRNS